MHKIHSRGESCKLCGMERVIAEVHVKVCKGNFKSQNEDYIGPIEKSQDETKTGDITSEFIDCGETIKYEIKQEDDLILDDPISVESELEAESIDCKETIKLEIKQEMQETEDLQDPLSTEVIEQDLHIDDVTIEEFKIEDKI